MGDVYVLGAGFSRTCNIATDYEMLDALNPLLANTEDKLGTIGTSIDLLRQQNFQGQKRVSFEVFMSTLSALKFVPEFMGVTPNVFAREETEIRRALKQYLRQSMQQIRWDRSGAVILEFVKQLNWHRDAIITFNYDLLVEAAIEKAGIDAKATILHLHGAINDRRLVYPTYRKLAYRVTRTHVAQRWSEAYDLLRTTRRKHPLRRLIFIGYSMPPSDLEAKGLFNYTDWDNFGYQDARRVLSSVPQAQRYGYDIIVVNPAAGIRSNYQFLRKAPDFRRQTLAKWLATS